MSQPVYFLVLPGVMALDLTGPAETLQLADGHFALHYIGPQPSVRCSTGMTLADIAPLPDCLPDNSLLVVPGVYDSKVWFDTEPAAIAASGYVCSNLPFNPSASRWSVFVPVPCSPRRRGCSMVCSAPRTTMCYRD